VGFVYLPNGANIPQILASVIRTTSQRQLKSTRGARIGAARAHAAVIAELNLS
jgi:hypothetical protein